MSSSLSVQTWCLDQAVETQPLGSSILPILWLTHAGQEKKPDSQQITQNSGETQNFISGKAHPLVFPESPPFLVQ